MHWRGSHRWRLISTILASCPTPGRDDDLVDRRPEIGISARSAVDLRALFAEPPIASAICWHVSGAERRALRC
jgi:hypothetical protein